MIQCRCILGYSVLNNSASIWWVSWEVLKTGVLDSLPNLFPSSWYCWICLTPRKIGSGHKCICREEAKSLGRSLLWWTPGAWIVTTSTVFGLSVRGWRWVLRLMGWSPQKCIMFLVSVVARVPRVRAAHQGHCSPMAWSEDSRTGPERERESRPSSGQGGTSHGWAHTQVGQENGDETPNSSFRGDVRTENPRQPKRCCIFRRLGRGCSSQLSRTQPGR